MGNQHSHPDSKCTDCQKVVGGFLHTFEKMGCKAAGGAADAGCQAFAIANFEDGVGEAMEPFCWALPPAFSVGCTAAHLAGADKDWTDYVRNAACKKAHAC